MSPPATTRFSGSKGEESSVGTRAARVLSACLEEVERFSREILERVCRDNPRSARAIRERLSGLRSAGLGFAVRPGRREGSAAWESVTSRDDSETLSTAERYEPIGPYQPLQELGRGGQGLVYLAEDMRLHRPVALKILKGFGALSEEVVRRFTREAVVASRLDHAGICAVYDAGVEQGLPYMAMRYVEGETLARKIAAARAANRPEGAASFVDLSTAGDPVAEDTAPISGATALPTGGTNTRAEVMRVVALLEKAARALHFAHEAGILHRDMKPGNIMVTPAGEPVLLDFGLAGDLAGDLSVFTRTGELFGTPAYMSPEQLMARRIPLDRRTDVYSLGVTLFECLTLRRPFEVPTREAMYQAIQYKNAPDPRTLNPQVPLDLKVVVEKAMEKDRDRRYSTALALAEDLRRVRENEPIQARPVGPMGRAMRWARRRPVVATLVVALGLGLPLLSGLGAYVITMLPEIKAAKAQTFEAAVERDLETGFSLLSHHRAEDASYAEAIDAFDRVLARTPECAEAVMGRAIGLNGQKRYQECLDFLEQHNRLLDCHPDLRCLRSAPLFHLGRKTEFKALAARPHEPTTAFGHFVAGMVLMRNCTRQKDPTVFRQAQDHFSRANLCSPHIRPMYVFQLAHAAGHLGDERETRRVARVLEGRFSDSADAWFWAGIALADIDAGAAIRAYEKAIALKPDMWAARYNLAVQLRKQKRFDEAIAVIEKGIELDPTRPKSYLQLALVLLDAGRKNEALEACEKAKRSGSDSGRVYYNLGYVMSKLKRLDEAIEAYRKAVDLNPDDAMAHYNLAYVLTKKHGIKDAPADILDEMLAHFRRTVDLDPEIGEAWACMGGLLCNMKKDYPNAIAALEKACELMPANAKVHTDLGIVYQNTRQWKECIEATERAIELSVGSSDINLVGAYKRLGYAYTSTKRWHRAARAYKKARDLDPRSFESFRGYAQALELIGRYDEAIVQLQEAIKLGRDVPQISQDLGALYLIKGDLDKSISWSRKALAIDSGLVGALLNLGRALSRKGEFVAALGHYRNAVALDHKNAEVLRGLSAVLLRTGDIQGAADAARKAIEADPELAGGWFTLGQVLGRKNDVEGLEGAVRAYRIATQKSSCWALAHNNLGGVLKKLRRLDEAEEALRRALKFKPDLWQAHCNLGFVLFDAGNLEGAVRSLSSAVELGEPYPWGSCCHYMLGICHWKLDHRKEAEAHWKKAVALIEKAKGSSAQDGVQSYHRLAIVLDHRGETERARGCLERFLVRKPEAVEGWINLGLVLGELGRFPESLEKLRKARELGIRQGVKWRVPSARLVERAKRRVELAKKLERVLQEGEPGSAEDMTILAKICHAKQRYACAARFYEEAFALDPGLKIPVRGWSENLLRAGCSAVQAASRRGKEKGTLAREERKRFRDLALAWLEEELAYLMAALDQGEEEDHARNLLWMIHVHRDLEPVRDSAALARLPDTERVAWQAFWEKVNTTLERLHAQPR